jgi:hypothetical protein
VKRHATLHAGDLLAQQFVLHAQLAQPLVGGTQTRLQRVVLGALLQRGIQGGQGALAPLLQPERLDPDLARDGLDRLTPQQSQDDVSLARRAPALAVR